MRRHFLNNVNTGINFWTADNESKNGNLNTCRYIIKVVGSTHCNSNVCYKFSVSQTPGLSSSEVEDIEEESPKRKENISGNHIIDVDIVV